MLRLRLFRLFSGCHVASGVSVHFELHSVDSQGTLSKSRCTSIYQLKLFCYTDYRAYSGVFVMGLMASGIATTEQGTKGPNGHMQDIYPFPQRQIKHVTCSSILLDSVH